MKALSTARPASRAVAVSPSRMVVVSLSRMVATSMVFALLGGLAVAPLGAQQPRPSDARPSDQAASTERANDAFLQVADYLDLERVGSPELSPDGTQIIYTRSHVNKLEDSWVSELWIMNVDGSRKRFLGKGSEPT